MEEIKIQNGSKLLLKCGKIINIPNDSKLINKKQNVKPIILTMDNIYHIY